MNAYTNKKRAKRSPIWLISKIELQQLIDTSSSYGEILRTLNLSNKGGNPKTLKARIVEEQLDCSLLNANRRKENLESIFSNRPCKSIEELLVVDSNHNRSTLKKRLLKEGLLKNQCYICGQLPEWNGKPLALQIDHMNGVSNDNRLENLRILCPHCHSQTDNFAGKNKSDRKPRLPKKSELKPNYRHDPRPQTYKVERPTKEVLEKLLWEKPTTHIAQSFKVSDQCVAKWAKSYGLTKPPRGYWTKLKVS